MRVGGLTRWHSPEEPGGPCLSPGEGCDAALLFAKRYISSSSEEEMLLFFLSCLCFREELFQKKRHENTQCGRRQLSHINSVFGFIRLSVDMM